jgi:hypothetical protein
VRHLIVGQASYHHGDCSNKPRGFRYGNHPRTPWWRCYLKALREYPAEFVWRHFAASPPQTMEKPTP